jgi:hypothetical protein
LKQTIIALTFGLSTLLILISLIALRPVPTVTPEEALSLEGTVTKIYTGGTKDIIIELADSDRVYYINRGEEAGLQIDALKMALLGKRVLIHYPDYWTPLDWNGKFKHLSQVTLNNRVIYSEFDA